jgi:hypothetical protein
MGIFAMQSGYCGTHADEGFTTCAESGARYQKRFGLIPGVSALSFLLFGVAEILVVLFGHNHSAADFSFHLQSIVIAGVSFGLCILTMKLIDTGVMTARAGSISSRI